MTKLNLIEGDGAEVEKTINIFSDVFILILFFCFWQIKNQQTIFVQKSTTQKSSIDKRAIYFVQNYLLLID